MVEFYCNNLDLLPPKPKFTFRHVKKGTRDSIGGLFWHLQIRLLTMLWLFEKGYCINTLKQELSTAKTYEHNRLYPTSIVDRDRCLMAAKIVSEYDQ